MDSQLEDYLENFPNQLPIRYPVMNKNSLESIHTTFSDLADLSKKQKQRAAELVHLLGMHYDLTKVQPKLEFEVKPKELESIQLRTKQAYTRSESRSQIGRSFFKCIIDPFGEGQYYDGVLWIEKYYFRISISSMGTLFVSEWDKLLKLRFIISSDLSTKNILNLHLPTTNSRDLSQIIVLSQNKSEKLEILSTLLMNLNKKIKKLRQQNLVPFYDNLDKLDLEKINTHLIPMAQKVSKKDLDYFGGLIIDNPKSQSIQEICKKYFQKGRVVFNILIRVPHMIGVQNVFLRINKKSLQISSVDFSFKIPFKRFIKCSPNPSLKKVFQISCFPNFSISCRSQSEEERELILETLQLFHNSWKQNNPKNAQKLNQNIAQFKEKNKNHRKREREKFRKKREKRRKKIKQKKKK
ncbi:hypothetical protein M0812_13477 [Anaeramoeba flamelloides]|uniref:Uncharacterized protein n=1 Tax=Anaeramoeba flamelloides TaxID=1746091 RepID=A0AAV7ZMA6_9EUKA|nr:hypothetical protein M0812_13477 [Anaeramoeba flamelloides]